MGIGLASLLPRKGRDKPGADGDDVGKGIAGDAGTYGCLAIDNIYNILHQLDRESWLISVSLSPPPPPPPTWPTFDAAI